MARFVNSTESISSSLMLWNDRPTQIAIEDTFTQKVWPVENNLNTGNPSTFNIPPQPNGMLTDLEVVTKFRIQQKSTAKTIGGVEYENTVFKEAFTVVNNFANSLWSLVEIKMDDRIDLMQSMHNAYAYSSFFNHALNSDSTHEDYLLYNEIFKMDGPGVEDNKFKATNMFWEKNETLIDAKEKVIDADTQLTDAQKKDQKDLLELDMDNYIPAVTGNTPNNAGGTARAKRVLGNKEIVTCAKLQCPLFNTSKCLPTNMKIRVSLTKNNDNFLILTAFGDKDYNDNGTATFRVIIEDVYLAATYYRPRDQILRAIEDRLNVEPAPYFISKPEIIIKPVADKTKVIRITDVFHNKLPSYAFFCLQKSKDFEGNLKGNPYNFIPFQRFQFYVNGSPYFNDALELERIDQKTWTCYEFGEYLRQLYRTVGKDIQGNCLINSSNFVLHFMVGMSFGADKSSTSERHLNLQEKASTYLEIDMGINEDKIPEDMILIIYAVYDRQIQIDGDRKIKIIE